MEVEPANNIIYVAGELRMAQYEKPLTKGHCPKKYKKPADEKEAEVKSEALAKRRTEKRERSHVLKEKITKLIESGLQLSEYQVCSHSVAISICFVIQVANQGGSGSNLCRILWFPRSVVPRNQFNAV